MYFAKGKYWSKETFMADRNIAINILAYPRAFIRLDERV